MLLLLQGSSTIAQNGFNRFYTNDASSSVYRGIVAHGKGWMIAARVQDSSTGKIGIRTIRMNQDGLIDTSSFFVLPDYPSRDADPVTKGICTIDNNHYVVYGVVGTTTAAQYSFLLMVDSNGKTIRYRDYKKEHCADIDSFFYNSELKYDGQGHLIMAGHTICFTYTIPGDSKLLISKFDTSFNLLWSKVYTAGNQYRLGFSIAIANDGYVLAGGSKDESGDAQFRDAILIKTDTAGVLKWSYTTPKSKPFGYSTSVICTKDGGYAFTAMGHTIDKTIPGGLYNYRSKRLIVKLDSNRNVLWETEIEDRYTGIGLTYIKMLELLDSSLIVAYLSADYNDKGKETLVYALLNRYNADGSLIWARKHLIPLDTPLLLSGASVDDLCYTEEKYFVIAGYVGNNKAGAVAPKERGWLIKVDSNGCLGASDPQCWPLALKEPKVENTIKIYPNPSNDFFEINNTNTEKTTLKITDIVGKLVYQEVLPIGISQINARNWAAGLYFYNIYQANKLISNGKLLKQ